ncbi:SMP-30/gluconolactonase/LRE family protein [Streptomyces sp. NY05-11A]|uniref:SMP-30/gluconolactonase/LRE family protein n=1 Tax=Streptomyces soliscabiei TaxID=588897 RepID=UPI0029BA8904|nr:SMP-30/gluconolactonase/LRE family protein [Streptomyces sp. NY05-11A]MDX2676689.1 SMP-30/gluconolactonase/LRE family protein [Streptomyces sp. NY05-11A]
MELANLVAQAQPVTARCIATGYSWPEIPRWHQGTFYFSDMYNHRILRLADDGTHEVYIDESTRKPVAPEPGSQEPGDTEVVLGGLGWLPDGRALVVSMHERLVLAWDGAGLETYADLRPLAISSCNDMVVDADGRAYVTQLGYDLFKGEEPRDSFLIVVEPDGTARNVEEIGGLSCGNGVTLTGDGTQLIVAEVGANKITAVDREGDGTLTNRRTLAETPWLPDGICLDDQGGVWVGMPGCGYVGRFTEDGRMTHAVSIPVAEGMGVACVLGGPDRSTLYICAGLEVFDWAKSREEGLGTLWTAETEFTGGTNRP